MKDNEAMVYILDQFRKHDITDRRVCRPENELNFLGETYLCYLNSTRNYKFIYDKYHRRADKSIASAAKTVGLTLPETDSNK